MGESDIPLWKQVRIIADSGGRGIIAGYREGDQFYIRWTDRRGQMHRKSLKAIA